MKNTKDDLAAQLKQNAFWTPMKLAPVPLLAELRELVLQRSEKRIPKWGFRLDKDLVLQLQPRPVSLLSPAALGRGLVQALLRFEAVLVYKPDGAPANTFRSPLGQLPPPWLQLKAVVSAVVPDAWELRMRQCWPRGMRGVEEWLTVRERLLDALRPDRWNDLSARHYLTPQCLICSKPLTDPASMARLVGPECAGTASLNTFMHRLPVTPVAG